VARALCYLVTTKQLTFIVRVYVFVANILSGSIFSFLFVSVDKI